MAYTTQEKAQFRAHAETVSQTNISTLTPQEKQDFENQYGQNIDALRSASQQDRNRLKLTIYANMLNPSLSGSPVNYINWIKDNVIEAQILINTMQPGALAWTDANGNPTSGEDNAFGPRTQRCIKALFGIDIAIPSNTPRTAVAWAVSATVNSSFSSADMLEMRRTILSDSHLKGELEKMGVRFVTQEDGEVEMVLPEGFENTVEYRQLQTYIKALHMTTDPEYTRASITDSQRREKMEMFLEITRGSGEQILGREYLGYKLINSINEDLKRDPSGPFIMTRNGEQGEYGIFVIPISRDGDYKVTTAPARANLPYHKLLEAGTIDDDYIDFTITYSLIEHNHLAFKGREFLGQGTLVKTILDKHGITGVSEEDIQNGNLLLADWDLVIVEIDAKLAALTSGNSQNVEAYQELLYVKDLIEGKQWMSQERNTAIFREVNTFGRVFLALEWKALIDDQVGLLTGGGAGEETPGEMIRNIIKENLFGVPGLLAIFIAIFNIWGLGKAAGMGLLWAAFGMAAWSVVDSVGKRVPSMNSADQLEIVRIRQLQYGIKWGPAVNAVLSNLYSENDNRNEQSRTTANRELFVQEPLVLGKILFEVSESNDLSTLDLSDNDLATNIFNQMTTDGTLAVTGDEFTSRVTKNPTITQEDVDAFVEILRSQSDATDTTLGDLLVAGGIDKLNHEYDSAWFDLTEYGEVNTQMHTIFRDAWAPATRENRKALLELLESSDAHLFSGSADAASDAWSAAATTTAGITGLFADGTGISVSEKIGRIWDLKTIISASTIDSGTQSSLLQLLLKYEGLLRKEEKFNTMRTSWYSNPSLSGRFASYTEWLNGNPETKISLENIQTSIWDKITDLNILKNGLTGAIYAELVSEINQEIAYLEWIERDIKQKLINLADFATVISGAGVDITTPIWLAQVTQVAHGLHDKLEKSIKTWTTDLFGALNSNVRQAIVIAYRDAANTARVGWDISTQTWTTLWNSIHSGIGSALWSIPRIGIILSTAVTSQLPSPINPTTLQARVLDTRTIDDIEAQVKFALIKAYLEDTQKTIQNYEKLEGMYASQLPTSTPIWASDTPEQAELRALLGSEHDDILNDIRTQITTFAQSYKWAAIAGVISTLWVSTSSVSLDAYEDASQFVANATDMDTQINNIKNLITTTFPNNPSFLDTILVDVTTLETDLNVKKIALQRDVESQPIVDSTAIWTLTSTDVWNDTTSGTIKWDIFTLKRVQTLLWWPWTSPLIDAAIPLLEARLVAVATVNQVPLVRSAIDADIITLSADIAPLTTEIATLRASLIPPATTSPQIDSKEAELDEKTALLTVLRDAIDATPFTITVLKSSLTNPLWYTPSIGSTTSRAFNSSYTTVLQVLNTL